MIAFTQAGCFVNLVIMANAATSGYKTLPLGYIIVLCSFDAHDV